MKLKSPYLVKPDSKVNLRKWKTDDKGAFASEDETKPVLDKHRKALEKLQEVLYAGSQKAVLVVLQGMDTAGKDGTIRSIFDGVNPQGCTVTSFKVPTPLEARHDFLWRCHAAVPPLGTVGVFNRSHYEDMLSPRVHDKMDKKTAYAHMDQINDFEAMLTANGVTILKFFLHISQEEQTARLQSRIDDKDKHWKISPADFTERKFWPDYQAAYEDIFERTSTAHAPWFVIPADHKWFRNVAISTILVDAMEGMKLKYPVSTVDVSTLTL